MYRVLFSALMNRRGEEGGGEGGRRVKLYSYSTSSGHAPGMFICGSSCICSLLGKNNQSKTIAAYIVQASLRHRGTCALFVAGALHCDGGGWWMMRMVMRMMVLEDKSLIMDDDKDSDDDGKMVVSVDDG